MQSNLIPQRWSLATRPPDSPTPRSYLQACQAGTTLPKVDRVRTKSSTQFKATPIQAGGCVTPTWCGFIGRVNVKNVITVKYGNHAGNRDSNVAGSALMSNDTGSIKATVASTAIAHGSNAALASIDAFIAFSGANAVLIDIVDHHGFIVSGQVAATQGSPAARFIRPP